MAKLKRSLGLTECVFFGVGSILGAGIYTMVGKVAGLSGPMIWLSFLLASITALCTAFSYAELSSAYPKAGGEYAYAKAAFGARTGTGLGLVISANGIIAGATVALGFAGYFATLTGFPMMYAALGIVGLIFLVNISGIRESSWVNIVFTIIEFSGLVMVLYVGIPHLGKTDLLALPPEGLKGLFSGAALAFFAFIGFEEIVKLAEETRNPEKTIPRALFISNIITIIMYALISICAVSVLPFGELANSNSPLADVVDTGLGRNGVLAISIIALFSTANTILSNMMGSSRVMYDMASKTKWLHIFSKVSPKRRTPIAALIFIGITMAGFAMIGKIETVAMIANIFIFITFLLVNLSVIVLRYRKPGQARPYKIPGSIGRMPLLPVLGICFVLLLFTYNLIHLLG